jgi:predicted ATPase
VRSVRHANVDTPTLLERQAELAAIDGLLGAARSGRGATLVVEGPAGIGKTSLLVTARQRAAERGDAGPP